MRILIHAIAALEIGGSERHLRGMVSVLGSVDPEVKYLIFVNPAFHLTNIPPNVEVRTVPIRNLWQRFWWDQVLLPRIVRHEGIDVIWATLYFSSIWPPVPQIMFHRNATYYCRHLDGFSIWDSMNSWLRRWLLYRIMRASCRIITPTFTMRDMVRAMHPDIPIEHFKVIPHAFNPNGINSALPKHIIAKLNDCPAQTMRLLYVGNILPGKGLFGLLDAMALIVVNSSMPTKLFLTISRDDWPKGYDRFVKRIADMGLTRHIEIIGKIPGSCMGALYEACNVLVYPSMCESFGFPLQEAVSKGLPIVAADNSLNREVAGEGALYYSPKSLKDMTEKLIKIITDKNLRSSLADASQLRFKEIRITWEGYVEQCLNVSRQL